MLKFNHHRRVSSAQSYRFIRLARRAKEVYGVHRQTVAEHFVRASTALAVGRERRECRYNRTLLLRKHGIRAVLSAGFHQLFVRFRSLVHVGEQVAGSIHTAAVVAFVAAPAAQCLMDRLRAQNGLLRCCCAMCEPYIAFPKAATSSAEEAIWAAAGCQGGVKACEFKRDSSTGTLLVSAGG